MPNKKKHMERFHTAVRYLKAFTPPSLFRLANWRKSGCTDSIQLRRFNRSQIELRGGKYAHSDRWIASEIFVYEQYVPPFPVSADKVRCIVDVGANVGYSIVFFAFRFPHARIVAFEPHPKHVDQIHHHLQINKLESRVTLYPAAAGPTNGQVVLSDREAESSITIGTVNETCLPVPMLDWFALVPVGSIDILKIDIEGAEFALMTDRRFDDVAGRTEVLALEWHVTESYPNAYSWCKERLINLRFVVYEGVTQYDQKAGTLWAFRN